MTVAGLCALVLVVSPPLGDDESEVTFGANVILTELFTPRVLPEENGQIRLVYDDQWFAALEGRLDALLRRKVLALTDLCRLSDNQRLKLQLAGRNDIRRFLERMDAVRASGKLEKDLQVRRVKIQRPLSWQTGLSSDDSFFGTMLDKVLSPEQQLMLEPIREVERAGGTLKVVARKTDGVRQVSEIRAMSPALTDQQLALCGRLKGLEVLELNNASITDAGLAHIIGLSKLRRLDLSRTQITDAGLVHLEQKADLQTLVLDETQIGDAGLRHLRELKQLKDLDVRRTNVTAAGVAELKCALPDLGVTAYFDVSK